MQIFDVEITTLTFPNIDINIMTAYLHSIMPYTAENYRFQGCQFLPVFVIEADRGQRFCEYRKLAEALRRPGPGHTATGQVWVTRDGKIFPWRKYLLSTAQMSQAQVIISVDSKNIFIPWVTFCSHVVNNGRMIPVMSCLLQCSVGVSSVELQTYHREVWSCVITEKAPIRAFFKTLC